MSELYHYGVKGMKWGVRKDQIKAGVSKAANKGKQFVYKQTGVNSFDELVDKGKEMLKTPQGVATLAAIIILPDPLVIGGMAAYAALKNKNILKQKVKKEETK